MKGDCRAAWTGIKLMANVPYKTKRKPQIITQVTEHAIVWPVITFFLPFSIWSVTIILQYLATERDRGHWDSGHVNHQRGYGPVHVSENQHTKEPRAWSRRRQSSEILLSPIEWDFLLPFPMLTGHQGGPSGLEKNHLRNPFPKSVIHPLPRTTGRFSSPLVVKSFERTVKIYIYIIVILYI